MKVDDLKGNKQLIAVLAVTALLIAGAAFAFYYSRDSRPGYPWMMVPPTACTLEAKLCPDGSYVGRTGPNCEFSACPGENGPSASVNSFEECEAAGYPIMESYPRQCRAGGKTFVEVIE